MLKEKFVSKFLKILIPAKFLRHAIEVQIFLYRRKVALFKPLNRYLDLRSWKKRAFDVPSPTLVKWAFLQKFGNCDVWIETGTYMGDTTNFLAKNSNFVYSIEPEMNLAELAKKRFKKNTKIEIIHGTSENEFEKLLSKLNPRIKFTSFS